MTDNLILIDTVVLCDILNQSTRIYHLKVLLQIVKISNFDTYVDTVNTLYEYS